MWVFGRRPQTEDVGTGQSQEREDGMKTFIIAAAITAVLCIYPPLSAVLTAGAIILGVKL